MKKILFIFLLSWMSANQAVAEELPWQVRYDFGAPVESKYITDNINVREVKIIIPKDSYHYSPDKLKFKKGEVVKLIVVNRDDIDHELILGDEATLEYEREEIAEGEVHAEGEEPAYEIEVKAGKIAQLYWQFLDKGDFLYFCLLPAHFENGMVGHIKVR